jgi:hypothetical protein
MIDYVVTVGTARSSLKIGRAIKLVDTKFVEISDYLRRRIEVELPIELNPIGR